VTQNPFCSLATEAVDKMRWKVNENATELFNIGCNHFCNSVIHIDGETFFAELSKTRDVLHYKFSR